jgi:hypothetical protein
VRWAITSPTMIKVTGRNGESIVFDGTYVAKLRHNGND